MNNIATRDPQPNEMAPKRAREDSSTTAAFPSLGLHGLIIVPINADGNCLFRALSDQLYGHQDEHLQIRALVVEEMRTNRELYESSLTVDGDRRAPKRHCRSSKSASPIIPTEATQAQKDRAWNNRLASMAKAKVWADSLEIKAFANKFGVNVRVWRKEFFTVFTSDLGRNNRALNVVYHDWEHYDSTFATSETTFEILKAMADDCAPSPPTSPDNSFAAKKDIEVIVIDDSDSDSDSDVSTVRPIKSLKTVKKPTSVIVLEDSDLSDTATIKSHTPAPKIKARRMSATKKEDNQGAIMKQMKVTAKEEFLKHMDVKVEQLEVAETSFSGKEN